MRLINTTTLKLTDFPDELARPSYAILSHRWEHDEVSYKQYHKIQDHSQLGDGVTHFRGHSKIRNACAFAKGRGWRWIWIDTCCIDKRSSAELSEAINSMFTWYRKAAECIVYLHDFDRNTTLAPPSSHETLALCEWFRRGWTLQELLAPRWLVFCDRRWEVIGHLHKRREYHRHIDLRQSFDEPTETKKNLDLGPPLLVDLATITNIPSGILSFHNSCKTASIAARMSWSANRVTSRPEDTAYCLLGIFGVNMPLLYGEGENSFRRLQEEILKVSHDSSIFAWNAYGRSPQDAGIGILAPSPRHFRFCEDVPVSRLPGSSPYSMTNEGLRVEVRSVRISPLRNRVRLWSWRMGDEWRPGNLYLLDLGWGMLRVEEVGCPGRFVVCSNGHFLNGVGGEGRKKGVRGRMMMMRRRSFLVQQDG